MKEKTTTNDIADSGVSGGASESTGLQPWFRLTDSGKPKFDPIQYAIHIHLRVERAGSRIVFCKDLGDWFKYDPEEGRYKADGERCVREQLQSDGLLSTTNLREVLLNLKTLDGVEVDFQYFNGSEYHLHLLNCVLDLETGRPIPHSADLPSLNTIPVAYDPHIRFVESDVEKFIRQTIGDENFDCYMELEATGLEKNFRWKRFGILVGPKNTGKTVLLNLMIHFYGNLCTTVSLHALIEDRWAPYHLYGKMRCSFDDLSDLTLVNPNRAKVLTGDGFFKAEQKFRPQFDFKNYALPVFACNKLPELKERDDAFIDRATIFECKNEVPEEKRDRNLLKKLTTPTQLSALLNGLLAYRRVLIKRNKFGGEPTTWDDWQRLSNPLRMYLDRFCEKGSATDIISQDEFKQRFGKFVIDSLCQSAWSKRRIASQIQSICPWIGEDRPTANRSTWGWTGIRYKDSPREGKDTVGAEDFNDF